MALFGTAKKLDREGEVIDSSLQTLERAWELGSSKIFEEAVRDLHKKAETAQDPPAAFVRRLLQLRKSHHPPKKR